tara:strand:+ start:42 stop:557 length:516 start_codon:yes stop_codon:yes gene_type:complete
MALPDLKGQNIQDTYQRVIQTDGTKFYDGTGSLVQIVTDAVTSSMTVATASFAISASVEITHEVSSSHAQTANSASYVLASNIDQPFINITASGEISASGEITAPQYRVQQHQALSYHNNHGVGVGTSDQKLKFNATNILLDAPVTASGHISASGDIVALNINGIINGGNF